jgi:hypothetical protein
MWLLDLGSDNFKTEHNTVFAVTSTQGSNKLNRSRVQQISPHSDSVFIVL